MIMSDPKTSQILESYLNVKEKFPPPKDLKEKAWVKRTEVYKKARKDPEGFWAEAAKELDWFEPWSEVLKWDPPDSHWFINGKINASYNCLDRHLKTVE